MNYAELDDEAFVSYLREHPDDQKGWEVLLQRYHRLIWYHLPPRDADAHDLYQEIQFAIWEGLLNRYSGKGKVVSYVGSIIVNQVIDHRASGRRRALRESLEDTEEMAGNMADPRPSANPEQMALHKEAGARVRRLLQRLNLKEQKMVILQYFGYTHEEISPILGIGSAGASRKFLSKFLDEVSRRCQQLEIDERQFEEGMRTLFEEGKLHEMLNC